MLTETCWCPPMVQKTAKKHRKVGTGRFSSGHFLVVSLSAILLSSCDKLDSWEGKLGKKQTVPRAELLEAIQVLSRLNEKTHNPTPLKKLCCDCCGKGRKVAE